MSLSQLREALARVQDPEIRQSLDTLGMLPSVRLDGTAAHIELLLTIAGCPAARRIEADVRQAALSVDGVESADITVGVMTPAARTALTERLRGGRRLQFGEDSLTRVIAVTSGKGGVGKSSVTANLAVLFAERGLRVGLIDADVHGYSIPGILGVRQGPTKVGDLMMPPEAHGVSVISIGMFVEGNASVSWRGPMLHRTIEQFLRDVWWGDLDVLLVDMPPGTGDIAISFGQLMPKAEVLVVTTPQRAAADVAERSALVARQTGQRVLGVVENMAGYTAPDGSMIELFGSGGGAEAAERLGTELLGRIPLSVALREGGDAGVPLAASPERDHDPAGKALVQLAKRILALAPSRVGRRLPISRA